MSAINLGRRFERLLLATAPITFASLLILFIAIASTTQEVRIKAHCYESIASALEKDQSSLNTAWDHATPITQDSFAGSAYKYALELDVLNIHDFECYATFEKEVNERFRASPSNIISNFKKEAEAINQLPLELYGVELPDKATINVLGTNINIKIITFARTGQLVLAPIIILWLGSLYGTRYRETTLIGSSKNNSENFPHLINVYPTYPDVVLLKRNRFLYHVPKLYSFLFACIRVALLMVFIAPPVIAYEWSLIVLNSEKYTALSIVFGLLVVWFACVLPLVEIYSWHYNKKYPYPPI